MATFIRLTDFKSSDEKQIKFFNSNNRYIIDNSKQFIKLPGSPIAYWISDNVMKTIISNPSLKEFAEPRPGLQTSDNDRFLRFWSEVSQKKIGIGINRDNALTSDYKWFPHNKGGKNPQKWYGNNEFVINFENDGAELKQWLVNNPNDPSTTHWSRNLRNYGYYFLNGVTWSAMSSNQLTARLNGVGYLFDTSGPTLFADDLEYFCGFINSKVFTHFVDIFSQTLSKGSDAFSKVPMIISHKNKIKDITLTSIIIAKEEWNSRETSWDFKTNELLRHKTSPRLEEAYNNYCTYWKDQFFKFHANEEEINRVFIDIYDLAEELTPDVPLEDITILKTESEIKDGELVFKKETLVKQFISYAVGCMFGRYSPDKEGLILANQGETIDNFRQKVPDASFMPDDDNIIPILEDEYFPDDIVGRFKEFLKVTFGAESIAVNLEFIAGALSKSKKGGGSPEKVIRDYFLKSFFKDHVKMYKKRPIYWLFTSGKGRGFNALVYMHRYDGETLAKMRTDYLLKLEDKLDSRIGMLSSESNKDAQEMSRLSKLIDELAEYDEVLNNKALEYIDIDLDDGVVVNYAKFEGLVMLERL